MIQYQLKISCGFLFIWSIRACIWVFISELIDENKEEMDQTDWLMQNVLHRIHHLSEPALTRLSDFLTGLEANHSIAVSEHQNGKNSRDDQSDS